MTVILGKVVSIFLMIGIGIFVNRIGVLKSDSKPYISSIIFKITCPCMIIASISSKELSKDTLTVTIEGFVGMIVVYIIMFAMAWIYCTKIHKSNPLEDTGADLFLFSSVNAGFMGLPITLALFGDDIFYVLVIAGIIVTVYTFSFGIIIIDIGANKAGFSIKTLFKSLLNPSTISAVIGIIMLIFGIKLPGFLFDCVDSIGDVTIPLSMILIGIQLGESSIKRVLTNKHLMIMSIVKMISIPIVVFLALNWLPISVNSKVCLIFASTFPSGSVGVAIAAERGRNELLIAEGVTLTTFMSMITLPIVAMLLMWYYGL